MPRTTAVTADVVSPARLKRIWWESALLALLAIAIAVPAITLTRLGGQPAAGSGVAPALSQTPVAAKLPMPEGPIALGATIREQGTYVTNDPSLMDQYARLVGRMPAIVNVGSDWVHFADFDPKVMDSIRLRGSIPMWTWQPENYELGLSQPKYKLSAIAHGAFDTYIRRFASASKAWGHVFFLRFGEEMNGNWYSWGTTAGNPNGNRPADFVAAWRHVHGIFTSLGAKNVKWVWCANITYPGATPDILDYPGDAYVDWVALDGYNWGSNPGHTWQSLYQVFGASYAEVTAFTRRPLMIAETGSVELGGSKADWIRQGFLHELPSLMPRIRAVIWFEAKAKGDWRVYTSKTALAAFRTVVASTLYGGNIGAKPARSTPTPRPG